MAAGWSRRGGVNSATVALSGDGEGGGIHTVELYRKVRLACREGMSERAAARHFGVSRESVRKMLRFSVAPGYRRTVRVRRPKLDGFTELIDQWLEEDRTQPRKQRHTAKRVFDRLRAEYAFSGSYTIVKDYVREHRRRRRELFVPRAHPPGHAQADFGEAVVVIGGVEQKPISSPSTCRTATRATCACTARRRPRHGSTGTNTRSGSSGRCRARYCMTTTGAWCRGFCPMGRAAERDCSAAFCRIT